MYSLVLIIAHTLHECRQILDQLSRLVELLLSIYDIYTLLDVNGI